MNEQRAGPIWRAGQVGVDPDPRLSQVLFRGDAENGGLLQFKSILAPSADQLTAPEEERPHTGQAPLAPRPD
ncbi:hypothetical protein [Thiocapsa bogorovii]|uniref:hypothetical protein n=1 Tax=Thiocapsa bogorovii TaxID=521689 RepID=UPI001E58D513|nr:hypothetical protein [Thiocapsa bogorovii]UHD15086.1 hypothetical protein LT988_17605 [Thiocapsa bogorovii]